MWDLPTECQTDDRTSSPCEPSPIVIESPRHESSDQKVVQNAYSHDQDYRPLSSCLLARANVAQIEMYLYCSTSSIAEFPCSQSDDGFQLPDKPKEDLYVLFLHTIYHAMPC